MEMEMEIFELTREVNTLELQIEASGRSSQRFGNAESDGPDRSYFIAILETICPKVPTLVAL